MFAQTNQSSIPMKPFFYTYSRPTLTAGSMDFDDLFGNLGLYTSSFVQFSSMQKYQEALSIKDQ